jgi:hypothetical protein
MDTVTKRILNTRPQGKRETGILKLRGGGEVSVEYGVRIFRERNLRNWALIGKSGGRF